MFPERHPNTFINSLKNFSQSIKRSQLWSRILLLNYYRPICPISYMPRIDDCVTKFVRANRQQVLCNTRAFARVASVWSKNTNYETAIKMVRLATMNLMCTKLSMLSSEDAITAPHSFVHSSEFNLRNNNYFVTQLSSGMKIWCATKMIKHCLCACLFTRNRRRQENGKTKSP